VEFLAWDLEKEHGDLGLGTLSNPSEPPLSLFGIAFRATKYGSRGIDWIQKIARYVDGSIMHAKLALDRIHISGSPEAVDLKTKRIPRNVQAHYNVAIRTMGQRTASSTMALKSVAAVGREGETVHGLPREPQESATTKSRGCHRFSEWLPEACCTMIPWGRIHHRRFPSLVLDLRKRRV
jgi:hypothetical protein